MKLLQLQYLGEIARRDLNISYAAKALHTSQSGISRQIALLERGGLRIGIAILTEGNPWTSYGESTLKGVARRILKGLPRVRPG